MLWFWSIYLFGNREQICVLLSQKRDIDFDRLHLQQLFSGGTKNSFFGRWSRYLSRYDLFHSIFSPFFISFFAVEIFRTRKFALMWKASAFERAFDCIPGANFKPFKFEGERILKGGRERILEFCIEMFVTLKVGEN